MSKLAQIQTGVLRPAVFDVPVSIDDYVVIAEAVLDKIAMNTNTFNVNSGTVTPSQMMLYFFVLLLTHVRKVGSLAGSQHMIVPDLDPDWCVPLPIAKWIEGLGQYREGGAVASSFLTITSDITWASSSHGVDFPYTWADNTRSAQLPNKNWFKWGDRLFEASAVDSIGSLTLSSVTAETLRTCSLAIADTGFGFVAIGDIGVIAPDASAYARAYDQENELFVALSLVNGNNPVFKCPFNSFHPEAAVLYSSMQALDTKTLIFTTDPRSRMCPIYSEGPEYLLTGTTGAVDVITSYNVPHHVFVYLWLRAPALKKGPIMKTTMWCGARIKTLQPSERYINYDAFNTIIIDLYEQLMSMWNNPVIPTTGYDPNGEILVVLYAIYSMALQLRMNTSVYVHNQMLLSGASDGHGSTQPYFVNPEVKGIPLPALMAEFINSIGPVAINGQMVFPCSHVNERSMLGYNNYANVASVLSLLSGFGRVAFTATPFTGANFLPINFGGASPATAITLSNIFLPNFVYNTIYVAPTGITHIVGNQQYPVYPQYLISDLIQRYTEYHEQNITGGSILKTLVHAHADPCGYADVMLSYTSSIGGVSRYFPDTYNLQKVFGSLATTAWALSSAIRVGQIGGPLKLLPKHVLRVTTVSPFPIVGPTASAVGKYTFTTNQGWRSGNFSKNFTMSTYAPGTAFGAAIGKRMGAPRPSGLNYGGLRIGSTSNDDSCWVSELVEDVWNALSPAAVPLATATAGIACAPIGMSAACGTAAGLLTQTLKSYKGIRAAGIDTHKAVKPMDEKTNKPFKQVADNLVRVAVKHTAPVPAAKVKQPAAEKQRKRAVVAAQTAAKGKKPGPAPKPRAYRRGKK